MDIFGTLLSWSGTIALAFITWLGGVLWKKNESFAKLEQRVALLEDNLVREDDVKKIIKDVLSGYLDDQKEIKNDVKTMTELMTLLRIDIGVLNASRGNTNNGKQ